MTIINSKMYLILKIFRVKLKRKKNNKEIEHIYNKCTLAYSDINVSIELILLILILRFRLSTVFFVMEQYFIYTHKRYLKKYIY